METATSTLTMTCCALLTRTAATDNNNNTVEEIASKRTRVEESLAAEDDDEEDGKPNCNLHYSQVLSTASPALLSRASLAILMFPLMCVQTLSTAEPVLNFQQTTLDSFSIRRFSIIVCGYNQLMCLTSYQKLICLCQPLYWAKIPWN